MKGSSVHRVLLLNPPADALYIRDQFCSHLSKGTYYWQPLDFLMLSGRLHAAGYDVRVVDAVAERLSVGQAHKRVRDFQPDAIVFFTGCDSVVADMQFIAVTKRHGVQLAIGMGDNAREDSETLLETYPELDACLNDFVTHGLDAFLRGDITTAHNMVVRNHTGYQRVPAPPHEPVFTIPSPRYELFPLRRYQMPFNRYHPYATTITSVWCPYSCNFCPFAKTAYRVRDVDDTLKNLHAIRQMGIRQVHFADWTFGLDRGRTEQLLVALHEARLGLTWSCLTRVDLVDRELLESMRRAGCATIEFGVESGSQRMLDLYQKKTTLEQITRTFRVAKEAKIATIATFIFGLPGETAASLQETLDLALEIDPTYCSFNMASPQPGTQLRRDMIVDGRLDPESDLIFDSSCTIPAFSTEALTATEVHEFWGRAVRKFYGRPSYLLRRLGQIRSVHQMTNHLRNGCVLLGRTLLPAQRQPQ